MDLQKTQNSQNKLEKEIKKYLNTYFKIYNKITVIKSPWISINTDVQIE